MQLQHWYKFINESHRLEFAHRFSENHEFAEWIGLKPFQITEIDDDSIFRVEDANGEELRTEITHGELIRYFMECTDMVWTKGFYMIEDVKGVLKSSINHRFWNEVGFNTFEVVKVDESEYNSGRTIRLAYVNKDMQVMEVNHTFSIAERSFFRKVDSRMTWNRPRGFAVSQAALDVLSADDEPEKDRGLLASEMYPVDRGIGVIEGTMVIRVEDEADRLRAIEMLQNLKWKK